MNASPEAQFNRVARAYMSSPVHARGVDLAWLVEELRPQSTWRVLDAGTGAGHAALAVAGSVRQVTAVDVAEHMLSAAGELAAGRGTTNLELVQASVQSLPFAESAFDAAFSRYSAHHWSNPWAALAEIARVLKPGASFVLIDSVGLEDAALDTYLNALELLRDPSHVRNATVATWCRCLADAGLSMTSVKRWNIDLETAPWLARSGAARWRAAAARRLLREAPVAARRALSVADDGESFSVPSALVVARREP
jgi:SAM-dependent methyltransferase